MIETKVFKISGMHCTSCAMNIDGELEDTERIMEANTNYARQETQVKFDPEKISQDAITGIIAKVGYTVRGEKAI